MRGRTSSKKSVSSIVNNIIGQSGDIDIGTDLENIRYAKLQKSFSLSFGVVIILLLLFALGGVIIGVTKWLKQIKRPSILLNLVKV